MHGLRVTAMFVAGTVWYLSPNLWPGGVALCLVASASLLGFRGFVQGLTWAVVPATVFCIIVFAIDGLFGSPAEALRSASRAWCLWMATLVYLPYVVEGRLADDMLKIVLPWLRDQGNNPLRAKAAYMVAGAVVPLYTGVRDMHRLRQRHEFWVANQGQNSGLGLISIVPIQIVIDFIAAVAASVERLEVTVDRKRDFADD